MLRDLLKFHLALSEHAHGYLYLLGRVLLDLLLGWLHRCISGDTILVWQTAVGFKRAPTIVRFLLARKQLISLLLLYNQITDGLIHLICLRLLIVSLNLRPVRSEHLGALNDLGSSLLKIRGHLMNLSCCHRLTVSWSRRVYGHIEVVLHRLLSALIKEPIVKAIVICHLRRRLVLAREPFSVSFLSDKVVT